MGDKKLKVAILSLTGQNKSYAEQFAKNPRVEVVAVTEDNPPPASGRSTPEQVQQGNRDWAKEKGVPFIENLDEVLARPDVDAISFSSAFNRRAPLVEKMAAAGKHIFGDKPLTENLADGDSIVKSVKKHGVKMGVGHNYTFTPAILEAKRALQAGEIGLPWAIHSEWVIATGKQAAGIGELRNHVMYPLDAVFFLVPGAVKTVYSITGSYFFDNARANNLEDLAFITMNMERDIIATTSLGRTPHAHPNGYGGDQSIRIMGTHGMIYIDANRPHWRLVGKSGTKNLGYGADRGYAMIDSFVDAVLNNGPLIGTAEDARKIMEVTLAALESGKKNQVINLPM